MADIIKSIEEYGIDEVIDDEKGFTESEILFDTEERLEPVDNGGRSTIEIYENDQLQWKNGTE